MGTAVQARQVFSPERLRAARFAAGRSLPEVGRAAGRHAETITDYEYGRIAPQADALAAIANFLGVDITEFFPLEDE